MLSCAPLWLYVILSFIAQEELQLVVGMLVYKSFLLCKIAYQVNIIVLTEGINSLLCLFDFFIICRILKICIDVCVHVLPFSYGKFQTHSKVKSTMHPLVLIIGLQQSSIFCQSCFIFMDFFSRVF